MIFDENWTNKFKVILADPPWQFDNRGTRLAPDYSGNQRIQSVYNVQSIEDIYAMGEEVSRVAADDSFLFLWTPNSILLEGTAVKVAEKWGFVPKQIITWVKTDKSGKPRIGGGNYTRVCTEQMLLCRKGKANVQVKNIPGVIMAPRTEHSAKPAESYKMIEDLAEGPYLELYARIKINDRWTVWGDQAPLNQG